MKFTVIDPKTGKRPIPSEFKGSSWVNGTDGYVMCRKWDYAIDEEGNLFVQDSCGNYSYPPEGLFKVVFEVGE